MFYPNVHSQLLELMPGYANERREVQSLIQKLLYLPQRDWNNRNHVVIPRKTVESWGHRYETFKKVNKKYDLYRCVVPYQYSYTTTPSFARWMPTQRVEELIFALHKNKEPVSIKPADTPKPKKGKTKTIAGVKIEQTVNIDMEGLEDFINNHLEYDEWGTKGRRYMEAAMQLYRLGNNSEYYGAIPQTYEQVNGGRIYARGLALQNTPRGIRNIALEGYYDFDMENLHYTILNHHGDFPTISRYLRNKEAIRIQISNKLQVSPEAAKQCLISLIYGAECGYNPKTHAIPYILGDSHTAYRFWQIEFVQGLDEEVEKAMRAFLKDNGLGLDAGYKGLSRELQKLEQKMLAICCGGESVVVPMHDGAVMHTNLNTEVMQDTVKECTGYDISITQGRIHNGITTDI